MKAFKQWDTWVSAGLLAGLAIVTLVKQSFEMLITSYLIIGGWQVISMLVHTFGGWFLKRNGARIYYHRFTAIILGCVLMGFAVPPFLFIFYFLLLASPFLAVSYTLICFEELKQLRMAHALNLK